MITIQEMNGYARKIALAYEKALLPLAQETNLPHTAISILLFIANNPDFATARDICELRGLKKPIVSTHVERLVAEGYIERRAVPGDRRKDALVCTEKAMKIIEAGRARQIQFATEVLEGISEEDRAVMERCFMRMNENIDHIIKEKYV
ncbi:MAG: MarR family transcriptional regulator [Ruminococcaceae bacterium]|nr:MarR family transcriptional regulator [Oscillospiraceae bacterium]